MNKFADKIHVLFRKEDIDPSKMTGKIVVVLDILFATTTIVKGDGAVAPDVIIQRDDASGPGAVRARWFKR